MCKRILSAMVSTKEKTHAMEFSSGIHILYGQEGEEVLLTLAGGCCTACFLYSYMLRPYAAFGTLAVVWGTGSGDGLEQTVSAFLWLRRSGLWSGAILLEDGGLDEEGRQLAEQLAERFHLTMI